MIDCKDCKPSPSCAGKEFYTPSEIRFCRPQVLWLIENLGVLRTGIWPPNPQGTSYTDATIRGHKRFNAYFETPIQIESEVQIRLENTGLSGKLLVSEINQGIGLEGLSIESRSALNYISGWRRRRLSFVDWKRQRRHRNKPP